MPVSEAARIMNENDTKLWRMIRRYIEAAMSGKDESGVKHMGIDEASVRGHSYIAVFADAQKYAIGVLERRCLFRPGQSGAAGQYDQYDRAENRDGPFALVFHILFSSIRPSAG